MSQAWQTEWMRIREVETEHYLMDIQGMFYELQPIAFEGRIWGVKPVCQHLRIIPDLLLPSAGCSRVGGNQTTANRDNNALSGQPQSGCGSARPTISGRGAGRRAGAGRGGIRGAERRARPIRSC